ncbi:MAG: hypothetical protein Ta2G_13960 [Termitinemataceae bacterium]|nr:MAG: hypothetical protein Ta2G_13960 [Termitinemataceae bacterium]
MENKKYLVVIDEEKSSSSAALAIVTKLFGNDIKVVHGMNFEGTDILPIDFLFIGCNRPSPASFAYFEDVLKHINLAGRECALFSTSAQFGKHAIQYMSKIISDSEIKLCAVPLVTKSINELQSWVCDIIEGRN